MFGLFKSQRSKFKEKGLRAFDNFLPALKGMEADEIGFVLDGAAGVKNATTMYGSKQDALEIFRDPLMVQEGIAFGTLKEWEQHIFSISETVEGQSKIAFIMIWYLSVIACQIPELRLQGRELWGELERGYKYTDIFDPDKDSVLGLEPNFE